MTILNAAPAETFYGLHMAEGVADYSDVKRPMMLILSNAIKQMDPTFAGRPVFVDHVDNVAEKLKNHEEDGWVYRSFFNQLDGKHWAEFTVHTEKGKNAIKQGYKLSNCYEPKEVVDGGKWHNVSYVNEVKRGEYEHLALVKNPRYKESVIYTPDQFKAYNADLQRQLDRVTNSTKETTVKILSKLNIFKRTKVENSEATADFNLDEMEIELPLSKKVLTLNTVVAEYDKVLNMQGYAGDDHMVKLNDEDEMSVNDLKKAFNKRKNEDAEKAKAEEEEAKKNGGKKKNEVEKSAELAAAEKLVNEAKTAYEATQEHFKKLQNAPETAKPIADNTKTVVLMSDKIKLGASKY